MRRVGCFFLAVQVYPGRPHYPKDAGLGGDVYVRVGSTNRRAGHELVNELLRFARGESFDEQAMPEFDSEALDFRAASEPFAPGGISGPGREEHAWSLNHERT